MAAQDFIRRLLPREDRFFAILEKQSRIVHLGATTLAEFGSGKPIAEVQPRVAQLEEEGDAALGSLEDALQETFVTPIDREDLQLLSDALDDVLDWTNAAARAAADFGVETASAPMKKQLELLVQSTRELEATIRGLSRHEYPLLLRASRSMRKVHKESEQVLREGLRTLFHDEAIEPRRLLREKEVLEDLARALDRCERVAYTLAHLSVKHG
jgi:hypothetical protein